MFNIVLFEPEIAVNTANIGRTCNLTNTRLHLIRPLGFILNDKNLRRAGLDYWQDVDLLVHDSFEDFMEYRKGKGRVFLATTKTDKFYNEVQYEDGDYIMFGSESKGVYDHIHEQFLETSIKIPMRNDSDRSLNVCNSANIVLYEALRQSGFKDMK